MFRALTPGNIHLPSSGVTCCSNSDSAVSQKDYSSSLGLCFAVCEMGVILIYLSQGKEGFERKAWGAADGNCHPLLEHIPLSWHWSCWLMIMIFMPVSHRSGCLRGLALGLTHLMFPVPCTQHGTQSVLCSWLLK